MNLLAALVPREEAAPQAPPERPLPGGSRRWPARAPGGPVGVMRAVKEAAADRGLPVAYARETALGAVLRAAARAPS